DDVAAGLARARPDVALLDIRMPGPDVFDVLSRAAAAAPLPSVIFATAYDGYAVRAFEMNAIDYLVKPYSEDRFVEAIRRVRDRQDGPGLARSAISARVPIACSCRTAAGWCPFKSPTSSGSRRKETTCASSRAAADI